MKKIIAASLAVVLLGTSTLSLADPPDWAGHQWNREHDGPYHHPDWHRDDWHRGDWRSFAPPPHMGKFKVSQNRTVENKESVVAALQEIQPDMAAAVERFFPK